MPSDETQSDASSLKRLDDFEILEKVASEGWRDVYQGRQIARDKLVTLYVLSPSLSASQEYRTHFEKSAAAALELTHPTLALTYGAGESGGRLYLAQEWLEGQTLFDLVKQSGTLPETTVAQIGFCVSASLGIAWANQRLMHGALTPNEILIVGDGDVKIRGLGLAVTPELGAGSISKYAAPEQQSRHASLDCRTDIFAFGAILYFALTGREPFVAPPAYKDQIPKPRELVPTLSEDVCHLLQRMLAWLPEDRFQSWDEVTGHFENLPKQIPLPIPVLPNEKSVLRLAPAVQPEPTPEKDSAAVVVFLEPQKGQTTTLPIPLISPIPITPEIPAPEVIGPQPTKKKNPIFIGAAIVAIVFIALGGGVMMLLHSMEDSNAPPAQIPQPPLEPQPPSAPQPPPFPQPPAATPPQPTTPPAPKPTPPPQPQPVPRPDPTREYLLNVLNNLMGILGNHGAPPPPAPAPKQPEKPTTPAQPPAPEPPKIPPAAVKVFEQFASRFRELLGKRQFADAMRLAETTAATPEAAPFRDTIINAQNGARRLDQFWTLLPQNLALFKGQTATIQGKTGKIAEVEGTDISLDIGQGIIGVMLNKATTQELLTLASRMRGTADFEAIIVEAWLAFAGGDLAEAVRRLEAAQREGADIADARSTMAAMSKDFHETEAKHLVNRFVELMRTERWTEARTTLTELKQHCADTTVYKSSQSVLTQLESELAKRKN